MKNNYHKTKNTINNETARRIIQILTEPDPNRQVRIKINEDTTFRIVNGNLVSIGDIRESSVRRYKTHVFSYNNNFFEITLYAKDGKELYNLIFQIETMEYD